MSTTSLSLPNTSNSNTTRKFKWVPRCKYLGTRSNKVTNICVYYTILPDEKQTGVDIYFFVNAIVKGKCGNPFYTQIFLALTKISVSLTTIPKLLFY